MNQSVVNVQVQGDLVVHGGLVVVGNLYVNGDVRFVNGANDFHGGVFAAGNNNVSHSHRVSYNNSVGNVYNRGPSFRFYEDNRAIYNAVVGVGPPAPPGPPVPGPRRPPRVARPVRAVRLRRRRLRTMTTTMTVRIVLCTAD